MGVTANEFPLLSAAGLYVKDTAGNGPSHTPPPSLTPPLKVPTTPQVYMPSMLEY
jgi:hypothetical protein